MSGRVKTFLLSLTVVAAPVFARAEQAAHGEEGGGSMPQLDPTFFPSQLFWLFISCVLLYVLMAKLALPRVAAMVDARDNQVRKDLEKAARLRYEAEDMQIAYTRSLRDADEKARTLLDGIVSQARDKQAKALSETAERIAQKITETEHYLRGEKEVLLNEVANMGDAVSKIMIKELNKA